eukprot:TRINITY_DN57261_c0_g1_i1.p1 TRINITY_DN57261_c0_g1~~TRINITY_DN57261_c0_g1_i1.p1  ORF type:complete len:395 (-),score=58.68 TRINITY_DN57261_c0_g1_i1:9-1193(-)
MPWRRCCFGEPCRHGLRGRRLSSAVFSLASAPPWATASRTFIRCGASLASTAPFTPDTVGSWPEPVIRFGSRFQGRREVPRGLRYCADFVSRDEEAEILAVLDEGCGASWVRHIRRAQQFFGLKYYQTSQDVPALQPTSPTAVGAVNGGGAAAAVVDGGISSLPPSSLSCSSVVPVTWPFPTTPPAIATAEPSSATASEATAEYGRPLTDLPRWLLPRVLSTGIFDDGGGGINQVAANDYPHRVGIGVHVEDPAVGGTIAALSLLAPVELTLSHAQVVEGRGGCADAVTDDVPVEKCPTRAVPYPASRRDPKDCVHVLLEPRSLVVLQGDSRYRWAHAIRTSRLVPLRDGSTFRRVPDSRRVSLTFRWILEEMRRAERQDFPDGYVTSDGVRQP